MSIAFRDGPKLYSIGTSDFLNSFFSTILVRLERRDIRFVQDFLGHSQMRATEIYTHVTLTKLKAVYEACHPGARADAPASPPVASPDALLQALALEAEDDVE